MAQLHFTLEGVGSIAWTLRPHLKGVAASRAEGLSIFVVGIGLVHPNQGSPQQAPLLFEYDDQSFDRDGLTAEEWEEEQRPRWVIYHVRQNLPIHHRERAVLVHWGPNLRQIIEWQPESFRKFIGLDSADAINDAGVAALHSLVYDGRVFTATGLLTHMGGPDARQGGPGHPPMKDEIIHLGSMAYPEDLPFGRYF